MASVGTSVSLSASSSASSSSVTTSVVKEHISICVSGHVDQGKSTLVGHLMFNLGGVSERELDKLKKEAKTYGKDSFEFAFYMDKGKESRQRGVTIQYATTDFYSDKYHFTIIDTPGHKDYIKNMLSGSACADVMLLLCSANDESISALAKGTLQDRDQGQTRQHARFAYLQGIKQLIIVINKMDTVSYDEAKFNNVVHQVKFMLKEIGWSQQSIDNMPAIPLSAYKGDNLTTLSTKMAWWKGTEITNLNGEKVKITTLLDSLNNYVCVPKRPVDKPFRMPVSLTCNIKGIGTVVCGRVEQGMIKIGENIRFAINGSEATAFSMEMHHKNITVAKAGDAVGICCKGLDKNKLPQAGDVMVIRNDTSLKPVKSFTAQIQVLNHPNELKIGYTPYACVRTGKASVKLTKINWKIGKETNKQKITENIVSLKAEDMAEVVFEPEQPFVVEEFKNCDGLGRITILEGNDCMCIGKIIEV